MSHTGWLFLIGAAFVLIGIGFFYWGVVEARNYRDALARRYDLCEFITRLPKRPEPGALKIGGVISIILGVFSLIAAFCFL